MYPTLDTNVLTAPTAPVVVPKSTTKRATRPKQHNDTASSKPARTARGPATAVAPVLPRDTVEIWDVPFDRLDMPQSIEAIDRLIARREPSYVITANLNYCMLNGQDAHVREITNDADLILADGQPIVLRSQLKTNPLPERVAGSEMIMHLCQRAAEKGHRVFFLGGAEGVAETCAARLQAMYPGLQIAGTECPPFRELSAEEHEAQLQRIRDAKTDLLFVAFGQPKGEKWIHANYRQLGVPVSIQLGASFDFIAGTATRAPEVYQRFGFEWAYRMFSDPRRLVPRYAGNAWFLGKALIRDWKDQVARWGMSPDNPAA
ncbi:N-acetylglucosaminyldiphosphoundecaprenol N-acetyl-beta-D-mannosaminyltransferase [Rhodopirellula rubra]|uniref:N-acetylglucosaminyldiphosphoundecaprenol N-acetyl-beta-D-mannosaminyltransferase n=1 Tax=Aporhodopirellula rubra TaxID=980271 RepID=A0A7W5H6T0_9BACT|nr:WecB/TagA/CpsF family glycosyltransferase [Aporhodopirellula rubra]MBB3207759.1 N-acetylglucosaminyldiphosphoundecaprenol N-acetyl-beta-D-mannosaminyltransferase [Aporhodopirellula rubra]